MPPMPASILAAGAEAFLDFENSGLSLAEIYDESNKMLEDNQSSIRLSARNTK